jgi:hypothetical protein
MADRSLKLLSKNHLDGWSIVGCIPLSCLNFWMKVCLPKFFEITGRQQGQLPRGRETDLDFLDNDQHFLDNRPMG